MGQVNHTLLTLRILHPLQVRRFYRPEDVGSKDVVYAAEWWEVYSGPEGAAESTVDVDKVVGKCSIKLAGTTAARKPG